jgi:hypothetical protein
VSQLKDAASFAKAGIQALEILVVFKFLDARLRGHDELRRSLFDKGGQGRFLARPRLQGKSWLRGAGCGSAHLRIIRRRDWSHTIRTKPGIAQGKNQWQKGKDPSCSTGIIGVKRGF